MSDIKVRIGDQNAVRVVSSVLSTNVPEKLSDLADLNITSPINDASILVYNSISQKWENSDELDGGEY